MPTKKGERQYRVTINGKPVREAPNPCDETTAKAAAFDVALELLGSDFSGYMEAGATAREGWQLLVSHHGGVAFIDIEWVASKVPQVAA